MINFLLLRWSYSNIPFAFAYIHTMMLRPNDPCDPLHGLNGRRIKSFKRFFVAKWPGDVHTVYTVFSRHGKLAKIRI